MRAKKAWEKAVKVKKRVEETKDYFVSEGEDGDDGIRSRRKSKRKRKATGDDRRKGRMRFLTKRYALYFSPPFMILAAHIAYTQLFSRIIAAKCNTPTAFPTHTK